MSKILTTSKENILEELILDKNFSEQEALKIIKKIDDGIACGLNWVQRIVVDEDESFYFIREEDAEGIKALYNVSFSYF